MSDQVFLLPDLGEGLTEAEVISWKVQVGDTVTVDQLVVEVETAKASVEVPIPFEGIVKTLHGEAGATVAVGSPLITVTADGVALRNSSATSAHEQYRTEERAGSGNVLIGYGTSEDTGKRRRRAVRSADPAAAHQTTEAATTASARNESIRCISPVVRKLARDNGVDITTITPARGSVITRADVERAIAAVTPPARPTEMADQAGRNDVRLPIKGLRKAVADKLSASRREIPDATTWVDVDATALLVAHKSIN
jgi:2-oxoisovalerate dehydrogenase E2 component (dihydrolipoyl transacylase)